MYKYCSKVTKQSFWILWEHFHFIAVLHSLSLKLILKQVKNNFKPNKSQKLFTKVVLDLEDYELNFDAFFKFITSL